MKRFIVRKSTLVEALSKVIGSVDKKQLHPVLTHALIKIDNQGQLVIIGCDLEVQVQAFRLVEAQSEELSFTMPAKKLYDFCRALNDDLMLEFLIDKRRITLIAGDIKLEFSSFETDQFPLLSSENKDTQSFVVNKKALRAAIESIAYAMAVADIRYYLNGLLFQIEGNELTLVATDGHRLACTHIPCLIHETKQHKLMAIVPRRAILELSRLIESDDGELNIKISAQAMDVDLQELLFSCKLIEGKYPDYKRVLPKDLPYKIHFEKEDMRRAIALIQPIMSSKDKGILLQFSQDKIEIKAINNDNEQLNIGLQVQANLPELKIGLNVSYLSDFIAATKAKTLQLTLQDDTKGVVLTDGGPGFYVVMPLRL